MSDDNLEKQPNASENSAPAEKKESMAKKSIFGNLNQDLKHALDNWETLTEEMTHKVSPEEEQLQEVKKLLGELKSKLQEFGD